MSMTMTLRWQPREVPLVPLGAWASGPARVRLLQRLLSAADEQLVRLQGVASASVLVILGAEADLPWVDGLTYLGREDAAPSLLLPTALRPDVAAGLLEAAVLRRLGPGERERGPWAMGLEPKVLVSVGEARRLERAPLELSLQRLTSELAR